MYNFRNKNAKLFISVYYFMSENVLQLRDIFIIWYYNKSYTLPIVSCMIIYNKYRFIRYQRLWYDTTPCQFNL